MTVPFFQPVPFNDLTVADLYTRTAQQNPHYDLVHLITQGVKEDGGLKDVRYTWHEVIQHAHNAARDLRTRAGIGQARTAGEELFVVGMLGINGYDYYMNLLGCVLNRWTVLLISPKNSVEGIQQLLKSANASLLLIDHLGASLIPSVLSISSLHFSPHIVYTSNENPASFIRLLTPEETAKEYDLAAFYLHTSGSTGRPKLIPWTHRLVLSGPRLRMRERPIEMPRPYFSIPPLSHAMGMFSHILFPPARPDVYIFIQPSPFTPIPPPPSAGTILQLLPYLKDGTIALPPSILEELWEMGDEAIESVAKTIWMIIFAGAALKHSIGDGLVKKGVPLVAAYGATEILPGSKMIHPEDRNDWEYVQWREGYEWHMLPIADAGLPTLRELVVGPAEDTPAVLNNANPLGYATNDIWEAHPSKTGLWRHHSRKGNVTVLSNGEKTDNKQVESLLLQNSHIKHVIVFGVGKPFNGVLLDPFNCTIPRSEFLRLITSTIHNANKILPAHSRLVPELILVTSPDKPLSLTDKDTVRNEESLELYKTEIKHAYDILEGGLVGVCEIGGKVNGEDKRVDVRKEVRSLVHAVLNGKGMGASNEDHEEEGVQLEDDADLFENGLDSLLSLRLRAGLISLSGYNNRPSTLVTIPRNVVYTHPSINALVSFMDKIIVDSLEERQIANGAVLLDHVNNNSTDHKAIFKMIEKYSTDFKKHHSIGKSREVEGLVIAMTGSTGTIGCTLLKLILSHQLLIVKHIYILNRPNLIPHRERQIKAMQERGMDPSILIENERKGKISYWDVDLSRSDLGLERPNYDELRDSITHLIHCAWHLNFNLVLSSYERVHVAGVRNLIDLCLSSPFSVSPRFVFASSIAAVAAYSTSPSDLPLIPESPIDDPSAALPQGYGQSKFVSERIIVRAVEDAGLQATIVRIGQLTGASETGVWNRHEHIPILMRSCLELGLVPMDMFETVHWTPSDIASSAFLNLILASRKTLEYFHIDNPVATQWTSIAEAISNHTSPPLRLVPSSEWLTRIGQPDVDPHKVPATVLIEFFRESRKECIGMLNLENTRRIAPELDGMGKISIEFVRRCLRYQAHE